MSLNSLTEWPQWEAISHLALIGLFIYVHYVLITDPSSRTVNNFLLLIIAASLFNLIHQNINERNNVQPNYYI